MLPLLMPLLGAGISALGGIGSSLIGASSVNRTNKANMQLAQYQAQANQRLQEQAFQQNRSLWVENNMYNSPSAQMARLKDAGLNPNLVYGSGSVAGNTSSPSAPMRAAQYQAPRLQPYTGWNLGLTDAVGSFMQLRQAKEQASLTASQRDMVNAQVNTERLRQANLAIKNSMDDYSYTLAKKLQDSVLRKAENESLSSYYQRRALQIPQSSYRDSDAGLSVFESTMYKNLDLLDKKLKLSDSQLRQTETAIQGLIISNDINSFNNNLYKATGLRPGDQLYVRLVRSLLGSLGLGERLDNMFNP